MKKSVRYQIALLAACAGLPAAGLFAQAPAASPSPAVTPSVSVPAGPATDATAGMREKGRRAMQERLSALTPEEREKLKAAHRKAMEDPALKTAEANRATDKRGYREAMRAAMLRADPTVGPILEKMREERPRRKKF